MADPTSPEVTRLLCDLRGQGAADDPVAMDRLFRIVYDEMRRLGAALMRKERPDHTLQATALVHEAYIKLFGGKQIEWQDRSHFLRVAMRAMRQILVDHARRRAAAKGSGNWDRVTLDEALGLGTRPEIEALALDDVLNRLSALDERMAHVVELRVFGGLTMEEVSAALGVSERTVRTDWTFAKAWLAHELTSEP